MIKTGIEPAKHGVGAVDPAAVSRSKIRLATRLWTLLHAQALLRGSTGGAGDALDAEDDRWRMAARREGTHRR
jgi:hypothetical protein